MSIEGRHLGEFETLERLGQGGMGAVYKARQKSLRRTVALKTLQASLAEDQEYIARFQQEAVAAAALNHPNLVQVYSAGVDEGLHWFAMEYVEGESAQTRLKREGRLNPLDAVAIVIHVATALEYGWRKAALIHRDIKPDNIFLSEDGEVKLGDLGLAKSAGQTQGLTVTGTMMGTPNYISPEQAQGKGDVDLRADIYSLGCTLYHLLSGQPPYVGASVVAILMKHVSAPVPDLSSVWPACPPELAALVMKMMMKAPEERPQGYGEVIAELRRIYDGLSTTNGQAETAPQKPSPGKSKLSLYAGLGIGAIALGAGAFFLFRPKEEKLSTAQLATPEREARASATPVKRAPAPASPASPAPMQAAESWRNVLGDPANLELSGSGERVADGVRFSGYGSAVLRKDLDPKRDGAVRMRTTFGGSPPSLRARVNNTGAYVLFADEDHFIKLLRYAQTSKENVGLRNFKSGKPLQKGEEYDLELRVVGNVLTVKFNGEDLGSVSDDSLQEGRFGSFGNPSTAEPTIVKSLEILNLDAAGKPIASLPATKDAPFVNSLGMKFVPVPINSGPTADRRMLFSVWHTRVQDYSTYARANTVDDSWKKQGQGRQFAGRESNHPVVGVSWEDAQAFCQWLTEKETAEGKLPKALQYRLPTDEEWSWAVGLPPESGTTPREKDRKNKLYFSWGRGDSPPGKAGNFADESFRGAFSPDETVKDEENKKLWMEGYDDGYATTSPVGSFPANSYGLHDMGGNAWQFCEDWFDSTNTQRVLRGQSWGNRAYPSSIRNYSAPGRRTNAIGFRCVIAASER